MLLHNLNPFWGKKFLCLMLRLCLIGVILPHPSNSLAQEQNFNRVDIVNSSPKLSVIIAKDLISENDATAFKSEVDLERARLEYNTFEYPKYRDQFLSHIMQVTHQASDQLRSRNQLAKTVQSLGSIVLNFSGGAVGAFPGGPLYQGTISAAEGLGHELVNYVYTEAAEGYQDIFQAEIEVALRKAFNDGLAEVNMSDKEKSEVTVDLWLGIARHEGLPPEAEEIVTKLMTETALELYREQATRMRNIELGILDMGEELKNFQENTSKRIESLSASVVDEFAATWEALGELSSNQRMVMNELGELEERVKLNSSLIYQNETNIRQNAQNIEQNRELIKQNFNLISENKANIEIINGYLYGTLDVNAKIQAIERGDLGSKEWTEEARTSTLRKLKILKTTETLTSVANFTFEAAGLISTVLPNSKAAQKISKLMRFTAQATAIGADLVSNLVPPNPLGIVKSVFKAFGLFKKKNRESPELQMMKRLDEKVDILDEKLDLVIDILAEGVVPALENIDQKLNHISDQLVGINQNIIDLSDFTFQFYSSTMSSFEFIFGDLDRINFKLDILINLTQSIYSEDFARCKVLRDQIQSSPIEKFSDHELLFLNIGASCTECLKGLRKITDTRNLLAFLMVTYIQNANEPGQRSQAEIHTSLYNKTWDYYYFTLNDSSSLYPGSQLASLTIPSRRMSDQDSLLTKLSQDSIGFSSDFLTSIEPSNFYNYEAINEITRDFLSVVTFYEIEGPSDYRPLLLEEYFKLPTVSKQQRITRIISELEFFENIINQAIAQQTLHSGQGLLQDLFQDLLLNQADSIRQNTALDLLESNYYVRQNLLKSVFANLVQDSASISELQFAYENLYLGIDVDVDRLKNAISPDLPLNFEVDSTGGENKLAIFFNPDSLHTDRKLTMTLPDYSLLLDKDMLYTPAVYELSDLRKSVNEQLEGYITSQILAKSYAYSDSVKEEHFQFVALSAFVEDSLQYPVFVNEVPRPNIEVLDSASLSLTIFPNPTNGQDLSIMLRDAEGQTYTTRIMDMVGRTIYLEEIKANREFRLPTRDMEPGIYLIDVSNGQRSESQKIIITK